MLNGQYDAARGLLDHTVRIEETGKFKEIRFVGGLTLRGGLALRENRLDDACERFKRALELYTGADHVYADAFTALTHCGLGEIGIRRGTYDSALEHYTRACEIGAGHPQKLGIGYVLVKSRLGLATVFHKLKMHREEATQFNAASELFPQKQGYDFNWMWEGSDAQAFYDFARYHAVARHRSEALASLSHAVASSWGDLPQLASEESFEPYCADPELDALRRQVIARGRIPEYPAELLGRVSVSA
jgi:tetratricopeptide (TPR) repeat protein